MGALGSQVVGGRRRWHLGAERLNTRIHLSHHYDMMNVATPLHIT